MLPQKKGWKLKFTGLYYSLDAAALSPLLLMSTAAGFGSGFGNVGFGVFLLIPKLPLLGQHDQLLEDNCRKRILNGDGINETAPAVG